MNPERMLPGGGLDEETTKYLYAAVIKVHLKKLRTVIGNRLTDLRAMITDRLVFPSRPLGST